jgi:hypothetical protein
LCIIKDCPVSSGRFEERVLVKITVELPDKLLLGDTSIVNTEEDCKGLKARLEKQWRQYLRRYRPLNIPIQCRFCEHVGEAQWHCHNPESTQNHLNVMPWNVCSKWSPNMGLLMLLYRTSRQE